MSTNTWEQHQQTRENPILTGNWGETPWEFYNYDQAVPAELAIRTSMCVPVYALDVYNPQVMLTLNIKRGGYEIPGGHLDPLENGVLESAEDAAVREVREETGLHVRANSLIAYGYTEIKNTSDNAYPALSYMQFFTTFAMGNPDRIIDPKVDGAGIFTLDALRIMANRGVIKSTELQLVCHGIRALLSHNGLPNEHI